MEISTQGIEAGAPILPDYARTHTVSTADWQRLQAASTARPETRKGARKSLWNLVVPEA
jgi:hypothetical protein